MDEFMDDMGRYMVRVAGLGSVEALFLINAHTDDEARRDSEIGLQSDPRRSLVALYKIERLNFENEVSDAVHQAVATYLLTGVEKEDKKKYPLNNFFTAESREAAKRYARERDLDQGKLYYCEPI